MYMNKLDYFIVSVVSLLLWFQAPIAWAKTDPESASREYKLGLADYKSRKYKSAAQHFYSSITSGNNTPQAWLYMGHSYSASGKKLEAKRTYERIVQLFRGSQAASLASSALKQLQPSLESKKKSSSSKSESSSRSSYGSSLPNRARVFYRTKDDDIILSVRIKGRPVDMVLDTGAPGISLDKTHLRKLGIPLPKGEPAGHSGGAATSATIPYWWIRASVQVGTIKKENMRIRVFGKMHTSPLLGQSFFKDFDYTIDHKARCVEFRRKGATRVATGSGYSLPFTFRKAGNRIVVQVEINGRKGLAMLDTGNTADGISFDSKNQMKKFGVKVPANAKIGTSVGVSGSGSQYNFNLRRVRLGPIQKSNVSASCALEIRPDDEELPLIGQEVLKGWQYTIDMKKKVIHFLRR